ncbi:hypothetical protein AAVH_25830 [Aphelenchoides avenae]|nr:hypothetical protein AAVH_25830 [Aphelenchus avenae]
MGDDTDTCFHQRLAVNVQGTIMRNESVPMAFARMVVMVLVKTANGTQWKLTEILGGSSTFMTGKDGSYEKSASPEPKRPAKHDDFPVDYMYAYEQGYDYKPFVFNAQLDKLDHEHPFEDGTSKQLED